MYPYSYMLNLVCLCFFLSHPGGNGTCFAERGSRNTCQRDMRFERRKRDGESGRRWKRKRGGRKLSEWSPIDEEDDNGARERESPTHFLCTRAAAHRFLHFPSPSPPSSLSLRWRRLRGTMRSFPMSLASRRPQPIRHVQVHDANLRQSRSRPS